MWSGETSPRLLIQLCLFLFGISLHSLYSVMEEMAGVAVGIEMVTMTMMKSVEAYGLAL